MTDRAPMDLDALAALPADDVRIARLAPHERAQLAAYREFLREPRDLPAERLADADARLGAALDDAMGLRPASPAPGAHARAREASLLDRLRGWFTPATGPAWAVAALVVLSVGVWQGSRGPVPASRESVMRGEPGSAIAVEHDVVGEGQLLLEWVALGEGVTYEVRWFDAGGLELLGRTPLGSEPRLHLRHGRLPDGVPSRETVVYQVVALRDGDEIARSASTPLRLP